MISARPAPTGRWKGLDGLRGLAAIVVVLHHSLLTSPSLALAYFGGPKAPVGSPSWLLTYTPLHLVWAGPEAVLVFFVLSGFVLTLPVLTSPANDCRFVWHLGTGRSAHCESAQRR